MKKADLKKAIEAGTPVAVHIGYRAQDEYPTYGVHSAEVIAVGQKRRVYSGRRSDFGGHITEDGVRVRFTDGQPNSTQKPITSPRPQAGTDEYEDTEDRIVSARDIIDTLDDYVRKSAQQQAAQQAAEQRKQSLKQRAEQLAERVGGGAEANYERGFRNGGMYDGRVVVSASALEALLEEAGK